MRRAWKDSGVAISTGPSHNRAGIGQGSESTSQEQRPNRPLTTLLPALREIVPGRIRQAAILLACGFRILHFLLWVLSAIRDATALVDWHDSASSFEDGGSGPEGSSCAYRFHVMTIS